MMAITTNISTSVNASLPDRFMVVLTFFRVVEMCHNNEKHFLRANPRPQAHRVIPRGSRFTSDCCSFAIALFNFAACGRICVTLGAFHQPSFCTATPTTRRSCVFPACSTSQKVISLKIVRTH